METGSVVSAKTELSMIYQKCHNKECGFAALCFEVPVKKLNQKGDHLPGVRKKS